MFLKNDSANAYNGAITLISCSRGKLIQLTGYTSQSFKRYTYGLLIWKNPQYKACSHKPLDASLSLQPENEICLKATSGIGMVLWHQCILHSLINPFPHLYVLLICSFVFFSQSLHLGVSADLFS